MLLKVLLFDILLLAMLIFFVINLHFQRYSVAVYLVRVFTAADLFNRLKLCSVESAERCRERSTLNVKVSFKDLLIALVFKSFNLYNNVNIFLLFATSSR